MDERDTGPEREAAQAAVQPPHAPTVDEAPGLMGPGVRPSTGIDPTLVTAWLFALLGYTPYTWWERILGFGFFGPIQVPAILAMVGVLFGFIAVLRALDLRDSRLRLLGGTATALGLVRLFLLPFF